MQETIFITATVKEGEMAPSLAFEPTNTVGFSFAQGNFYLGLRAETTIGEAQDLARHINRFVDRMTYLPDTTKP
jgi:hypothetical protein